MKTKTTFIALLLVLVMVSGFAQESSKKEQRERVKMEKRNQVEALINSREFVFSASRALPQSGQSIDLTTNPNRLSFHPDKIMCFMPYFGRAYHVDYGGDAGIRFEGKPKEFRITTGKRGKGYEINVKVPAQNDNYQLNLFVSPDGSATLSINCNNRSAISYFGEIGTAEEPKTK